MAKKKYIFFNFLIQLITPQFDVLHIETILSDNVMFTLLNASSNKCKANLKERKDLQF